MKGKSDRRSKFSNLSNWKEEAQHLQAPAKRSPHRWAQHVARVWPHYGDVFRLVVTCRVLEIELVRVRGHNIVARA